MLFLLSILFAPAPAFPYAVSTGTVWATEAAIDTLRHGGNAVDAMVAATFVLGVTQPYNMGIGGGGFFLAAKNGKTYYWNHREMAPASANERMFLDSNGKPLRHYPEAVTGPNPIGVPGTVAGLYEAHKKLGALPWKKLVAAAIERAKLGFPLYTGFARILDGEWPRISAFPSTAAVFGDHEGGPLRRGRVLRNALLAHTLERIADGGAPEFYAGALAQEWIAEAGKVGVKITLEDLKSFKVREEAPIEFHVFGLKAFSPPPPSASGLMVAGTLRYLEHYYKEHDVPAADSPARVITTTEVLRYYQELRNAKLADEGWSQIDPRKYLGSSEERSAWAEIDKRVGERLDKIRTAVTSTSAPAPLVASVASYAGSGGHTAHMSIVDDHGMAVSYTTTNEEWFGSGITVPGFGFLLNNELSDFTSEPGTPNSPAPGKRPRSNMSPLILMDSANKILGVVGCAGGGRIPTAIVELLEGYYLQKMTAREAIAFPRFHPEEGRLLVETTMPASTVRKLRDAGYDVQVEDFGATAQALLRHDSKEGWEAATEPRADGLGIVIGK
jgi:gamma-glutamyltranspeptidase/glutathione hydrolase